MNVPLSIVFIAEVISIITQTEALPFWKWGAKSEHKRWNWHRSETEHGCSVGQCVKAWKCPEASISEESTGSCSYWSNGPWVCCVVDDVDTFHHRDKTNIYFTRTLAANEYSKQTVANSWKQNTRTTTGDYRYDNGGQVNTPCLEDTWNRNKKEGPSGISPLGDIFKNAGDKYPTPRLWNKTTKIPQMNASKKTTQGFYKKISPVNNMMTANSWNKSPTPVSRIIFPTENAPIDKATRYQTLNSKTSKTASYSPSTKSWTRSTRTGSTKVPWGYTAIYTGRTVSKTTWRPYSRKPTVSTRATTSQERRNLGRGNTTTPHPARDQTKRPISTNKPISSLSTTRSTRRYQATTPLPNVNIYMCGIRDQRTVPHRQGRNSNYRSNPVADVVRPGAIPSKGRLPYERIVGGKEAEPFSWPWVTALYKVTSSGGNRFLSAGSLINENFVLTAAHVFTPDDLRSASYVVMLGTHDAQDAVAEYIVSSVVQHPRYEHRYYYHDIALLRLRRPVIFNNYVMPVCLPSPNAPLLRDRDLQGKNVTVMGWGDDSFGGKSSRVLKEATFPILSRVSCNASYVRVASNRFPKGITNDMLCAGDPNGGKDACQGDSGGPLTSIENGRYTQVGIVSFGYKCGDKQFPGVYTKVAPYLSWIAENTVYNEDYIDYDY